MATDGLRGGRTDVLSHARQFEKLVTLVLLSLMLAAAVAGVAGVLTSQDWGSLLQSAILGLLVGWGLALFHQPAWRTTLIVLILGLIYLFIFPGGLAGKLIAILVEVLRSIPEGLAFLRREAFDLVLLARSLQDFFTSAAVIMARLQAWFTATISGQPAFDPVAASLVWNALMWLVAAWAGWVIEARRNVLLAASPVVFLSAGTLAYGQRMSFALYLMLGSLLSLLSVVRQDWRERAWKESGAAYPAKKGRQIIRTALIATLFLVIFSAFTSSISIQRIQEWISEHTRSAAQRDNGNLGESLGIIPGSTAVPDIFETVRSPGMPEDHLIGSGPELSKRIVMTVAVHNPSSLSQGEGLLPVYWRSLTYDMYTRNGWRTSATESESYSPDQSLGADHAPDRIRIEQAVSPVENLGGTIYAAGEPVTIDLRSEVAWRSFDDLFGVQTDQSSAYHVISLIPMLDERTLRAAGQKYPDWIRRRYLALPTDLPDRVKALALELTASEPTPYDRAKAIERYLRTFPYTLKVARPPLNRDVVDYFLFDLKKGYCDYYASAMVVLARAAGVPARLAIGYASGTYNLNSERFTVTEADAHSWVEIYFPDIGWVPFEPTANRPLLEQQKTGNTPQPLEPTAPAAPQAKAVPQAWHWLLGGAGLVVLLGGLWVLVDEIRLRRLHKQAAAVEVYERMKRYGSSLGVDPYRSDTPYEFATSLTHRMQGLMRQNFKPAFISDLLRDVQALIAGIVQALYNPYLPEGPRKTDVLYQWKDLRWKLRLVQIFNYFNMRTGFIGRKWGIMFERDHNGIEQEK